MHTDLWHIFCSSRALWVLRTLGKLLYSADSLCWSKAPHRKPHVTAVCYCKLCRRHRPCMHSGYQQCCNSMPPWQRACTVTLHHACLLASTGTAGISAPVFFCCVHLCWRPCGPGVGVIPTADIMHPLLSPRTSIPVPSTTSPCVLGIPWDQGYALAQGRVLEAFKELVG